MDLHKIWHTNGTKDALSNDTKIIASIVTVFKIELKVIYEAHFDLDFDIEKKQSVPNFVQIHPWEVYEY